MSMTVKIKMETVPYNHRNGAWRNATNVKVTLHSIDAQLDRVESELHQAMIHLEAAKYELFKTRISKKGSKI